MALIHSKPCLIIQRAGLLSSPLGDGKHAILSCSLYYRRFSMRGLMSPPAFCDIFLRCLLLYRTNIKGKLGQQGRKKHAVLQETSAIYFQLTGNRASWITPESLLWRLSWGDAFFFTCTGVKTSEEIPSLLLRPVYPKSREEALSSLSRKFWIPLAGRGGRLVVSWRIASIQHLGGLDTSYWWYWWAMARRKGKVQSWWIWYFWRVQYGQEEKKINRTKHSVKAATGKKKIKKWKKIKNQTPLRLIWVFL